MAVDPRHRIAGPERGEAEEGAEDVADTDDEEGEKPSKISGFVLEFDAARKIAQGLGIHLDKSPSVVEVKGDKARLLPVAERTKYLFGKEVIRRTDHEEKAQEEGHPAHPLRGAQGGRRRREHREAANSRPRRPARPSSTGSTRP